MPMDLTISGGGDPLVAAVGRALGDAGVNIEGTFGSRKLGEVHVLVEDAAPARRALEGAGLEVVGEREVFVRSMKVLDRPGSLGQLAHRLAEAGVEIDFHYVAMNSRIVIAVDDSEKATAAMQVWGG